MGQALLGIEIGNSNIKVVHGTKKGKTLHLFNYSIVPTPQGSVRDGFIMDMDAVYDSMKELLKRKWFSKQNAAMMVQGTSIITRDILMPPMEEKELKNVFDYQKDEYFPIDVSDYQTDFKILNEVQTEEGKKLNVLLVAAPNSMIESSLELLKRLNLKPKFIDITSNSIAKIFAEKSMAFQGQEAFAVMVLDLGGQTTTATILSEGNIVFSRSILFGLDYLNALLGDEIGESDWNQIESFKRKYAAIYDQTPKSLEKDLYGNYTSYIIKPAIEHNLIQEINRFLEFYYSRNNAKGIKTIYLVGGGAHLKNIDRYIERALNIRTMRADNLENMKVKRFEDFEKDFLYLVNALGLVSRT